MIGRTARQHNFWVPSTFLGSLTVVRGYSTPEAPLKGIRVVDFSRILAGPYCTMAMADMGAEVIKIERPGIGDDTREWGPPFVNGQSTYFMSVNRNKKSITVDIKKPEGLKLIKSLVRKSDVVVENFVPGTTKSLGIDYESLKKENEKLVYASISGFGSDGPRATRRGYDVMLSALGGLMSITGEPNGPPVKVGVALTDVITGLWVKSAISSALLCRYQTGKGSFIECSLLDAQIGSLVNVASAYLNAGIIGKRWGTAHPSIVPYQAFSVKDGYIVLGANNDEQWQRLCEALELPELAEDEKFFSNSKRVENREELIATLQKKLKEETRKHWESVCGEAHLPVCSVNDLKEVFDEPQVQHNQIVQEVTHPEIGKIRLPASPVKINKKRPPIHTAPPTLGENTSSILTDLLQLSPQTIKELKEKKII